MAEVPVSGGDSRVDTLHGLKILDTPDESRFDSLIEDLSESLGAPIAYLALIDAERQWLKSSVGDVERETPRVHALCHHVVEERQTIVVADASKDPRFADSPLVAGEDGIRFYAAVPIADSNGEVMGTVCIADRVSRELSDRELAILHGYAKRLEAELQAKPTVLIAYSTSDVDWVQALVSRSGSLAEDGHFDLWSDLRISGEDADWKLQDSMQRAKSVVVYLSEAFLRSDFVAKPAFKLLLRVWKREGVEIAPVLVEPCSWEHLQWLSANRRWSEDSQALSSATDAEIEFRFLDLVSHLRRRLERQGRVRSMDAETEPSAGAEESPAEARRAKLFLSHASEDGEAVKELAAKLRLSGIDVWLDIDELAPGDNWMERLETALEESDAFAVYIGRIGIARWINREVRVALDRSVRDPRFRVIPILGPGAEPDSLPPFLAQNQWLDLRTSDRDLDEIKRLVGAILDRPAEAVSLLPPGEAPFRGLLPFDEEHALLFFGRDRETEELLERLERSPFLAVIGDSGSGKSSLVRAGMIPALHRGVNADRRGAWKVLTLRPGRDPFRELSNALPMLVEDLEPAQRIDTREACSKQLREGTDGLSACISSLVPAGEKTLIFVDQFEELFTQSCEPAVRDRFIDSLLEASDDSGDHPIHTVITLRADFFSECFQHPRLPEILSANQYPVRAIDREQLIEVIERPAAMAGLRLQAGLLEAILHDLGSESSNLALLEHTLLELWELRTSGTLTHDAYESLGRVQGALEHHAEAVFAHLDSAAQKHVRRLLCGLVVPGSGGQITRRRVPLEELAPAADGDSSVRRSLDHLVNQRLLTVRQSGEGESTIDEVEVTHEALLRGWKRMRGWLDEDREFLQWRQRNRSSFDAWEEADRDGGALLRGAPLAEARRWLGDRREDLGDVGIVFIEASVERQRRARRRRRNTVAGFAALALVAVVAALAAWLQRSIARDNFEFANNALLGVGKLTEVARGTRAEQPEIAELKRTLTEGSLDFYQGLADRGVLTAELRLEEAIAHYRHGNLLGIQELDGAEDAYAQAASILESLLADDGGNHRYTHELANTHNWWGEHLRLRGDAEAQFHYDEAIALHLEIAEHGDGEHLLAAARTFGNRGAFNERVREDFEGAEADYLTAIEYFQNFPTLDPQGTPSEQAIQGLTRTYTNYANLLNRIGRQSEAETFFGKALASGERLETSSPDNREYAFELALIRNNLAGLYAQAGRLEEAAAMNDQAMELFEELTQPIPWLSNELGNSHQTRAAILIKAGPPGEAIEAFDLAVGVFERLFAEFPEVDDYRRRYGLALLGLGLAAGRAGDLRPASSSLEKIERLRSSTSPGPTREQLESYYEYLSDQLAKN